MNPTLTNGRIQGLWFVDLWPELIGARKGEEEERKCKERDDRSGEEGGDEEGEEEERQEDGAVENEERDGDERHPLLLVL